MNEPVVLITGASTGFGKATADHLASRGMRVFGTSRRAPSEPVPPEGKAVGDAGGVTMLNLDVRDDESARACVESVMAIAGRIDVLVNNAGYGLAGAFEETSLDEARAQLETNLLGAARMMQAVLPRMREAGAGRIINISSLAALVGVPFHPWYTASKFALSGLSDSVRLEVHRFGIQVCAVEPSDFATEGTQNRVWAKEKLEAYTPARDNAVAEMIRSEQSGPPPEGVAKLIERLIHEPRLRARYRVGNEAAWVPAAKALLPSSVFESLLRKNYKME